MAVFGAPFEPDVVPAVATKHVDASRDGPRNGVMLQLLQQDVSVQRRYRGGRLEAASKAKVNNFKVGTVYITVRMLVCRTLQVSHANLIFKKKKKSTCNRKYKIEPILKAVLLRMVCPCIFKRRHN
jgi:hypothetical protein